MSLSSKKMIFVRGVLGVCPRCGGEVQVERHVRLVVPTLEGLMYHLVHSCGFAEQRVLAKAEHSQITQYLRQVAQGLKETGPALSMEEELLRDWHVRLDLIKTDADLLEALGS